VATISNNNGNGDGVTGGKRGRGAPPGANAGNRSHESHGLVTLQNAIRRRVRRRRSLIDRRYRVGQEALRVAAEYAKDLGGEDNLTTGQRVVLGLLAQNLFMLGETDKRINKACRDIPRLKNSPKGMAVL
jgi:hypothetical protein